MRSLPWLDGLPDGLRTSLSQRPKSRLRLMYVSLQLPYTLLAQMIIMTLCYHQDPQPEPEPSEAPPPTNGATCVCGATYCGRVLEDSQGMLSLASQSLVFLQSKLLTNF